jgi:hypothetical protein
LRWYLGYDLTEPLPDHSSLTRIFETPRVGDPASARSVDARSTFGCAGPPHDMGWARPDSA